VERFRRASPTAYVGLKSSTLGSPQRRWIPHHLTRRDGFVYNVLMASKHVGELEHMVLLAIVRLGPEAYGMSILRELEDRANREVSRGGLYLVLERMVEKGYLETRMGDPSPERGGRAKRFFQLTDLGSEVLRISGRSILAMWDGLEPLLEQGR